jgi:hypothetical protein
MADMTIHRIRLSKMQKVINVLAVSSAVVSAAVVIGGATVYVQRDAIVDSVKAKVQEAVLGSLGGLGGGVSDFGGVGGDTLPTGTNDLSAPTDAAAAPAAPSL